MRLAVSDNSTMEVWDTLQTRWTQFHTANTLHLLEKNILYASCSYIKFTGHRMYRAVSCVRSCIQILSKSLNTGTQKYYFIHVLQ
jgi:hypothetical protein